MELRIADFKSALKIAPAKTYGNLFCEARRRFLLADRHRHCGDSDRNSILFRRGGTRFHGATSKPHDAQFHAQRELVWRLALRSCRWIAPFRNRLAGPGQKMDANCFGDVNGARNW